MAAGELDDMEVPLLGVGHPASEDRHEHLQDEPHLGALRPRHLLAVLAGDRPQAVRHPDGRHDGTPLCRNG
eukprot:15448204-Alexandrium_andersonii.AAC.1